MRLQSGSRVSLVSKKESLKKEVIRVFHSCCMTLGKTTIPVNFAAGFIGVCSPVWWMGEGCFFFFLFFSPNWFLLLIPDRFLLFCYTFWIQVFVVLCSETVISHSHVFHFLLNNVFWWTEVFNVNEVKFINFYFGLVFGASF